MCLIVYKPSHMKFPESLVKKAQRNNPHGFGLMYAEKGRVEVRKTCDAKEFCSIYRSLANKSLIMHFRLATHGQKNIEMAHPVQILDNLWMVHNGVIGIDTSSNRDWSDTKHFAEELRPILSKDPTLLQQPEFVKLIEGYVGKNNKLVFLDGKGRTTFVNPGAGLIHDTGCWISNDYSLTNWVATKGQWKWSDDDSAARYTYKDGAYIYDGKRYQAPYRIAPSQTKALPPARNKRGSGRGPQVVRTGMTPKVSAPVKVKLDEPKSFSSAQGAIDEVKLMKNAADYELKAWEVNKLEWYQLYTLCNQDPARVADFIYRFFNSTVRQQEKKHAS